MPASPQHTKSTLAKYENHLADARSEGCQGVLSRLDMGSDRTCVALLVGQEVILVSDERKWQVDITSSLCVPL